MNERELLEVGGRKERYSERKILKRRGKDYKETLKSLLLRS